MQHTPIQPAAIRMTNPMRDKTLLTTSTGFPLKRLFARRLAKAQAPFHELTAFWKGRSLTLGSPGVKKPLGHHDTVRIQVEVWPMQNACHRLQTRNWGSPGRACITKQDCSI